MVNGVASVMALIFGAHAMARFDGSDRAEHFGNALVAIALKFLYAAPPNLLPPSLDDALDQRLGQRWRHQFGPRQFQRRTELLHEVPHAGIATGERVRQERAHERPADASAKADRIVDLAGRCNTFVDQMQRLAPQ